MQQYVNAIENSNQSVLSEFKSQHLKPDFNAMKKGTNLHNFNIIKTNEGHYILQPGNLINSNDDSDKKESINIVTETQQQTSKTNTTVQATPQTTKKRILQTQHSNKKNQSMYDEEKEGENIVSKKKKISAKDIILGPGIATIPKGSHIPKACAIKFVAPEIVCLEKPIILQFSNEIQTNLQCTNIPQFSKEDFRTDDVELREHFTNNMSPVFIAPSVYNVALPKSFTNHILSVNVFKPNNDCLFLLISVNDWKPLKEFIQYNSVTHLKWEKPDIKTQNIEFVTPNNVTFNDTYKQQRLEELQTIEKHKSLIKNYRQMSKEEQNLKTKLRVKFSVFIFFLYILIFFFFAFFAFFCFFCFFCFFLLFLLFFAFFCFFAKQKYAVLYLFFECFFCVFFL